MKRAWMRRMARSTFNVEGVLFYQLIGRATRKRYTEAGRGGGGGVMIQSTGIASIEQRGQRWPTSTRINRILSWHEKRERDRQREKGWQDKSEISLCYYSPASHVSDHLFRSEYRLIFECSLGRKERMFTLFSLSRGVTSVITRFFRE